MHERAQDYTQRQAVDSEAGSQYERTDDDAEIGHARGGGGQEKMLVGIRIPITMPLTLKMIGVKSMRRIRFAVSCCSAGLNPGATR